MHMRRMIMIFGIFSALAGFGAITMLTPAQAAAPMLTLVAPNGTQPPNAAVDVEVRIANATNLGAFEFDLEYDPALVQVTGLTLRDFLGQAAASCDPHSTRCAIALGPRAQANGTSIGAYSYGTGAGANGDGVLAVLHLQTTSQGGTASLHLANALITDTAANPATPAMQDAMVQIQLADTSPPIITPSIVGTAGVGGWYRSAVTVNWAVSDPESGIASSSGCGATSLTTPTAGTSLTCSATNGAGLSQTASVTIKIDTTPPVVNVTGVTQGTTYTLGAVPAAGCTTTDALSGVATLATLSVTGGTNRVGTFTATCSGATDKAGNTGSASVAYTVKVRIFLPILPTSFDPGEHQKVGGHAAHGSAVFGAGIGWKFGYQ